MFLEIQGTEELFILCLNYRDFIRFCSAKRAHLAFAINVIQYLSTARAFHMPFSFITIMFLKMLTK
jgi:hypothetical protein